MRNDRPIDSPLEAQAQPSNQANQTTPELSLLTYALAAVASSAYSAISSTPDTTENRFLLNYLTAEARGHGKWLDALDKYTRQPSHVDLPLIKLAREFEITTFEALAVTLAAAVDYNVMVGRVLAHLQAPLGGSRPTLGLIAASLGEATETVNPIEALVNGVAVGSGLLTLLGEGAPLPERTASIPMALSLALRGYDGNWPGTTINLGEFLEVTLPQSIVAEAQRHGTALSVSTEHVLVIRTGSVAEGRSVASFIAQTLERRPLFIETVQTTGLVPWLSLRQLLPVFCIDLAPGERKALPPLPFYRGPVLVLSGPDGSVETPGGTAVNWSLPVPPKEERRALWQSALGDDDLAEELAKHHRHGSGRIAHLGRLAHHQSLLNGREAPTIEDIVASSWTGEGGGLDALAQPMPDPIPDEALMLSHNLRDDLDSLLSRCRARDGLVDSLGPSAAARYKPGVRALFVGPSGTGKTLAAGWVATRLGLPLYRVDLASVTSKYIGETEKNLAQLLARAEQAEVVLLFDEADSLFGKRTDVQQANDRFANAQTNYLLQRIESFEGITILTSNSRSRFDQAFSRRLDLIIEFPAPDPEERRSLWQSHLGKGHRLSPQELNRLAATADLSGGQIRNVVLMAAVLAQEESRLIKYADIAEGLVGEYRKLGKNMPVGLKVQNLPEGSPFRPDRIR